MRLLHTADWHLGRAFHGEDLLGAQAAFVDFARRGARGRGRSTAILSPATSTTARCRRSTRCGSPTRRWRGWPSIAPVVVISGNHDSAARLGFGARAARARGRACVDRSGARSARRSRSATAASTRSPTSSPISCASRSASRSAAHAAAMGAAMDRVRADLAPRGPAAHAIVVMAHAFVAGGDAERERARPRGRRRLERAGLASFDGIDYVALGHLHGPQVVGGGWAATPARRWRSRSPRRARRSRSRWSSVDGRRAAAGGAAAVPGPARRSRRCAARSTSCSPTRALADREDAWVQATLTDPVRPTRRDGAPAPPLPVRGRAGVRPAGRRRAAGRLLPAPARARTTTSWCSASSPTRAAARPTTTS